jgi:hypothetical protein
VESLDPAEYLAAQVEAYHRILPGQGEHDSVAANILAALESVTGRGQEGHGS